MLQGKPSNYAIKRDCFRYPAFESTSGGSPLFWLLEPKMQNRVGWVFFSGSSSFVNLRFVFAFNAAFALSSSPPLYPPSHSIFWLAMAVKSYFRQDPQSWAVSTTVSFAVQRVAIHAFNRQAMFFGIHGLPAARQFKLLAFQT